MVKHAIKFNANITLSITTQLPTTAAIVYTVYNLHKLSKTKFAFPCLYLYIIVLKSRSLCYSTLQKTCTYDTVDTFPFPNFKSFPTTTRSPCAICANMARQQHVHQVATLQDKSHTRLPTTWTVANLKCTSTTVQYISACCYYYQQHSTLPSLLCCFAHFVSWIVNQECPLARVHHKFYQLKCCSLHCYYAKNLHLTIATLYLYLYIHSYHGHHLYLCLSLLILALPTFQ